MIKITRESSTSDSVSPRGRLFNRQLSTVWWLSSSVRIGPIWAKGINRAGRHVQVNPTAAQFTPFLGTLSRSVPRNAWKGSAPQPERSRLGHFSLNVSPRLDVAQLQGLGASTGQIACYLQRTVWVVLDTQFGQSCCPSLAVRFSRSRIRARTLIPVQFDRHNYCQNLPPLSRRFQ